MSVKRLEDEYRIKGDVHLLRTNVSGDCESDIGIRYHTYPDWSNQHEESYYHINFLETEDLVETNKIKIGDYISLQLRQLIVDFEIVDDPRDQKKIWRVLSPTHDSKEITEKLGENYSGRNLQWSMSVIGQIRIIREYIILDIGIPLILDQWHHDFPNTVLSKVKEGDWIRVHGHKLYGEFIEWEKDG
jgi:hypothetical protein